MHKTLFLLKFSRAGVRTRDLLLNFDIISFTLPLSHASSNQLYKTVLSREIRFDVLSVFSQYTSMTKKKKMLIAKHASLLHRRLHAAKKSYYQICCICRFPELISLSLFFHCCQRPIKTLQKGTETSSGREPKSGLGRVFNSSLGRSGRYCMLSACHRHLKIIDCLRPALFVSLVL